MNDFPEQYSNDVTERAYAELNMPDESVELLKKYFSAFGDFYQRIPLSDAFDIIQRQNEGLFTREQLIAFSEVVRHQKGLYYFIIGEDEMYDDVPVSSPEERELVHESLIVVDEDIYYDMVERQGDKPLYVLEKDELLKYGDEPYYEKSRYTEAVRNFFRFNLGFPPDKAENRTMDCVHAIMLTEDNPIKSVIHDLSLFNTWLTRRQYSEFLPLLKELINNTRVPYHRGFTQKEIYDITGNEDDFIDNIAKEFDTEYADEYLDENETAVQTLSDGRNKPCPCGSGKKFKNCCGRYLKGT